MPRRTKPDAITLIKEDHRTVEDLFGKFEKARDDERKKELARRICTALTIHSMIEEEILYPEERGEVEDDMLDEAYVEHDGAKKLIAEIEAMQPGDEFYDAKVKVLGEYITHHVVEEHTEMFPKCRRADMELVTLRGELESRKMALVGDAATSSDSGAALPPGSGILARINQTLFSKT